MTVNNAPLVPSVQDAEPVSTAALVRDALTEVSTLVRAEIALARVELRHEARSVFAGALAFAAAGAAAALGCACLLVAFALAIFPHPLAAVIVGGVLLAIAVVAAVIGLKALPTQPMSRTRERLETDTQAIKEQFA